MPQFPTPGRMGSQMMRPRFGGGRGPMMGMNRAPQFPMMGGPQQMNGGGGGLLSRLLGRGAPSGGGMNLPGGMNGLMGMQQAGRAAGGGGGSLMQSLTNPGGISTFLNNTQQVLRTAQSIGPMIQQFQQYGSLIRNLPAMWKLFQGIKNAPSNNEEESNSTSESKAKKSSAKVKSIKSKTSSHQDSKGSTKNKQKTNRSTSKHRKKVSSKQQQQVKGGSVPKLYIK